jgi:protein-disulfide isomerase
VDGDVAFGNEMKVIGTPTLFVNGMRVSGYRAEQIRTLIREQAVGESAAK